MILFLWTKEQRHKEKAVSLVGGPHNCLCGGILTAFEERLTLSGLHSQSKHTPRTPNKQKIIQNQIPSTDGRPRWQRNLSPSIRKSSCNKSLGVLRERKGCFETTKLRRSSSTPSGIRSTIFHLPVKNSRISRQLRLP